MASDAGAPIQSLRVDGGAATNDFLCQFQADMLGVEVLRPAVTETTGLGAAYLAGVGSGALEARRASARAGGWIAASRRRRRPRPRETAYRGWRRAVERARAWVAPET